MVEALEYTLGIVAAACKRAEVPRRTFYNWYESDSEFRAAVDEVVEVQIDYVEGQLLQLIKAGDTTAIIFYLRTKGKKHGWNDKTEKPVDDQPVATLPPPGIVEATAGEIAKEVKRFVKQKKDYFVKLLKKQGKYTAEMTAQVEIAVKLYAKIVETEQIMAAPGYSPILVEISREGNKRESENPTEERYRRYMDQYQRALRALGMNKDAKDTKTEQDGFGDFLNSFKDEE